MSDIDLRPGTLLITVDDPFWNKRAVGRVLLVLDDTHVLNSVSGCIENHAFLPLKTWATSDRVSVLCGACDE